MTDSSVVTNGTGPHIPSRKEARERRKREERGFMYPLPHTGGVAHVKIPSLATIATHAGLPADAQEMVLRVFREAGTEAGANVAVTWDRLARNQDRQMVLANAMCIAGFVVPRLVLSEDDLPADDDSESHVMTVDDLHVDERLGFLQLCIGQNKEQAAALEPFPEPGLRRVEAVSADASNRRATVATAEYAEEGV